MGSFSIVFHKGVILADLQGEKDHSYGSWKLRRSGGEESKQEGGGEALEAALLIIQER